MLGRYLNRETLRQRVAGAVGDSELVLGIVQRSDFEAVANRGVECFDRRIEAHALGGVYSITNRGHLSAADGWRAGVEIENLQAVASQGIGYAARFGGLCCGLRFFAVATIAPAAVEYRAIIGYPNNDQDGEIRKKAPKQACHDKT
jgi:hypothetical protein